MANYSICPERLVCLQFAGIAVNADPRDVVNMKTDFRLRSVETVPRQYHHHPGGIVQFRISNCGMRIAQNLTTGDQSEFPNPKWPELSGGAAERSLMKCLWD